MSANPLNLMNEMSDDLLNNSFIDLAYQADQMGQMGQMSQMDQIDQTDKKGKKEQIDTADNRDQENRKQKIFEAIMKQDVSSVKSLVRSQDDVNFCANYKMTAESERAFTPLSMATLLNQLTMVQVLIALGARVTQPYLQYPSLLELARQNKNNPFNKFADINPEIIDLLSKKALEEISSILKFDQVDPCYQLAFLGDIRGIQDLQDLKKVDLVGRHQYSFGQTTVNIFMMAALGGNLETLKFLFELYDLEKQKYIKDRNNRKLKRQAQHQMSDWYEDYRFNYDPFECARHHISLSNLFDIAALGGYICIIDWLHNYRNKMLIAAKKNKELEIISNKITLEQSTAIVKAVERGHIELVQYLLNLFPQKINTTTEEGTNLLMLAAGKSLVLFKMILSMNERLLTSTNNVGLTVLHSAAQRDSTLEVASFIIEKQPMMLYAGTVSKTTPLMVATWCGAQNMVKLLLQADLKLKKTLVFMQSGFLGINACHIASGTGNLEILKLLVNYITTSPWSLSASLSADNLGPKGLQLLLSKSSAQLYPSKESGTSFWAEDLNMLFYAVQMRQANTVRYLLEVFMDAFDKKAELVKARTTSGTSLIHLAARGDFNIFMQIIQRYPELAITYNSCGLTVLMYACTFYLGFDQSLLYKVSEIENSGNSKYIIVGQDISIEALNQFDEDRLKIVKYLLEHWPTMLFEKDQFGNTIFDYVKKMETLVSKLSSGDKKINETIIKISKLLKQLSLMLYHCLCVQCKTQSEDASMVLSFSKEAQLMQEQSHSQKNELLLKEKLLTLKGKILDEQDKQIAQLKREVEPLLPLKRKREEEEKEEAKEKGEKENTQDQNRDLKKQRTA